MTASAGPAGSLRIVVPRYGPDVMGGSEILARSLATELTARGWAVQVLTSCARSAVTWANELEEGNELDGGVNVQRFRVAFARRPGAFRQLSRAFFRLPGRLRPERLWVAAQGPYLPALPAQLAAGPVLPTLFTPYLYYPTLAGLPLAPRPRILIPGAHPERPLGLRLVGSVIRAADALWYGTDEERLLVERVHRPAAERPFAVGTIGISAPEIVDIAAFRRRHSPPAQYLMYAGRAEPGKELGLLLAGFARLRTWLPDVGLLLAGPASDEVGRVPGVQGLGALPRAELWAGLAGASAVVVPSALESLSMLSLEAWAVGSPVLANAGSAVLTGQLARSGGGIPFRDAEELASAAARLLREPRMGQELGAAGRAYVRANFRWGAAIGRLQGLIEAVRAGRGGLVDAP